MLQDGQPYIENDELSDRDLETHRARFSSPPTTASLARAIWTPSDPSQNARLTMLLRGVDYRFQHYQRAVPYGFSTYPLSALGRLTGIGGRFNFGGKHKGCACDIPSVERYQLKKMVRPAIRRQAVGQARAHAVRAHGMSERRACRISHTLKRHGELRSLRNKHRSTSEPKIP